MNRDGISVFVYGTLLRGEANHRRLASAILKADRAGVRGALYDTGRGYPAMLTNAEGEGTVRGEIYEIDEPTLRSLDELEDYYGPNDLRNEYERIRIEAETADGAVLTVWTYVYKRVPAGCERIASGDWRERRQESKKGSL